MKYGKRVLKKLALLANISTPLLCQSFILTDLCRARAFAKPFNSSFDKTSIHWNLVVLQDRASCRHRGANSHKR